MKELFNRVALHRRDEVRVEFLTYFSHVCLILLYLFSPNLRDFSWGDPSGASTSFKQSFQASTCGELCCLLCGAHRCPSHWVWDSVGRCAATFGAGVGGLPRPHRGKPWHTSGVMGRGLINSQMLPKVDPLTLWTVALNPFWVMDPFVTC